MLARFIKAGALIALSTGASMAAPLHSSDSANWYRDAAVSPDGSQIVFRYSGQLWLVPSKGGDAIPLTSESVFSSHPIWSPDGKSIAFSSNRYGAGDVFSMDVQSGELTRLTYHPSQDVPYAFSSDGQRIYFESMRIGRSDKNVNDGFFGEAFYLYSVGSQGGREKLELANGISSFASAHNKQGYLYTNRPSFVEQAYRKHHTSSAARDIWLYQGGKHLQLTQFKGEDRDAHWSSDDSAMYYLSERSGSFNVWRKGLDSSNSEPTQQTFFKDFPVRALSVSNKDDLVFSYDGDIWLKAKDDEKSHKVDIHIRKLGMKDGSRNVNLKYEISEFAISPTAPEAAIVARGDIFVVSMRSGNIVRVTHTPEKEASVSFSADGKSLYYTSERNGNWDIYKSEIAPTDESFITASSINEQAVTQTDVDETQPLLSPDNGKLAYRVNSNSLVVENLKDNSTKTLISAKEFYSYEASDWHYSWSPDSRYMVSRLGTVLGKNQIALFDTSGKQDKVVLNNSGFIKYSPKFSQDGQIVYWFTPRDGNTELDGSPVAGDIYALALNPVADYNWFRPDDGTDIKSGKKEDDKSTQFEANGLDNRLHRLTPFSLDIKDMFLSPDNKDLLVIYSQKDNYVFADINTKTGEFNQMFTRPKNAVKDVQMSPSNDALVILGNGMIDKVTLANHKSDAKYFDVQAEFNFGKERDYIFNHVWRMTKNRFYDKDLHGVDWNALGQSYSRYLPSIHTYPEFAEMLSEMVGELNASHTGANYFGAGRNREKVASLGVFYDDTYQGEV
ncbi:protease-related protein [Vibrio sp. JCM 19236]|nr:protease-related protein [Vibrio sp. JCM 19236]